MEEQLKITSLTDLKKYAKGNVVELPPFGEGQRFVARLKRPSLMNMVREGKIPNSLLTKLNELFVDSSRIDTEENEMLGDMIKIFDAIAEETFVEPTFEQIKEAGIQLTDDQYMFVFNYSQRGVKALESFRTE